MDDGLAIEFVDDLPPVQRGRRRETREAKTTGLLDLSYAEIGNRCTDRYLRLKAEREARRSGN
jgi:hypothetical protein